MVDIYKELTNKLPNKKYNYIYIDHQVFHQIKHEVPVKVRLAGGASILPWDVFLKIEEEIEDKKRGEFKPPPSVLVRLTRLLFKYLRLH